MIPTGSYITAVISREVRDLADLGSASRSLGERWEQVGGTAADGLVGQELRSPAGEAYACRALLRLDEDPALLRESAGRGLKSPDCLFAGHDRLGRLVLQPGDFKFTLDVASRDQIDPAPIRALLAGDGPLLNAALARLLAAAALEPTEAPAATLLAALDAGRARLLPGFFLSPDEPTNRLILRQAGRRRGGPTEADVRLLPVTAASFFAGLPGAEAAPLLRERDEPPTGADDFPTATYYFQLGAAVSGAVRLLQRPLLPLLGPEPAPRVVERLQAHLARWPALCAIDAARDLAAPALQRRERLRLASRLAGSPLRGRLAYEALEAAGWRLADEPGPRQLSRGGLKELLDAVEVAHTAALTAELAARLAEGPLEGDTAILDWLRQTRPRLEALDRAELTRRLAALAG